MPLLYERNDITKMKTDAIVIPANEELVQGSGTSTAIYEAAGEDALEKACRMIGHCDMGRAVITKGFNLPAKYIIHAVCPRWYDGESNEQVLLYSAYTKSLELAAKYKLKSIAFPLLSAGNYEYPRDKALMVASQAISAFLMKNDMDVYIVFYDSESVATGKKLSDFGEHIDDEYVEGKDEGYVRRRRIAVDHWKAGMAWQKSLDMSELETDADMSEKMVAKDNLEKLLKAVEDPFSVKLKQYVEKSGKKKKDIYAGANMKKKQFYALMSDSYITPRKSTVLGLAVGLELSLKDTKDLLASAGYMFSPSSGADIIVEHFIRNRKYSHGQINLALYENGFEESQIGTIKHVKTE